MSDNQDSFLNIKQNSSNSNQEQLDDSFIKKKLYKNKNQKGQQFEKFKPKTNKENIKNEKSLKGAENKLKSMLSVFLKNIESEEINENKKPNPIFKGAIDDAKKQNNKNNSIKKVKTISISHKDKSHSNYTRANSFRLSPKKINSNSNSNTKKKQMSLNKVKFDLKNKKLTKKKITKKDNISSAYQRTKSYNEEQISKKKLNNIGSENIISNKKNNYTESNKKILIKPLTIKSLNINENLIPNLKKLTNQRQRNKIEDRDSILTDNSNSILKKSMEFKNSIIEEPKLTKLNGDNNSILSSFIIHDTSKTNIINHSQLYAALLANDNISLLYKKNSTLDIKNSSENSNNTQKRKYSIPKGYNRSCTYYSMKQFNHIKNNNTNAKIFRHNTIFKSLRETLKQTIILRPEELKLSSREIYNNRTTNKSIPKIRGKSKFGSNVNIPNIPKTESNLNNNKIENIVIKSPTIISEHIKNSETDKKKNENSKIINDTEISDNFNYTSTINRNNTKAYLINKEKYRLLIHKGNVYDSLDDEEIEEEEYESIYLSPNSKFIIIFDGIMFLFSIISLIGMPLYLAKTHNFCKEKHLSLYSWFNMMNELINVIDTFLGFFRAFYNFEEQLITKNSSIIKNYLKSWFVFDLLASVPVYSINKFREKKCYDIELNTYYYNNILDNIHYLLIINRLLKIIKSFSLNQFFKVMSNYLIEFQFFSEYGNMLLNIFFTTSALNFSACIYIFIARNSYPNWILQTNLDVKSFIDIYICSIYILIMAITTVGYGDITCYSFNERIFQLVLLIVGIIAYSWLVTAFSNHIKKINEKYVDFDKKKLILDEIKLKNPSLSKELYDRTLRYLKFKNFYDKQDKNLIFDCLPVSLKNNLIVEMYKPIINNFLFFKNFQNTDFIIRVIFSFRPIIAIKNDILVNEGEKIEDIMFVKKGILSLEIPINTENPQENIEKYLTNSAFTIEKGPDLEKVGNSIIAGIGEKTLKNSILDKINNISNFNSIKKNNSTNKKEKKKEKNITSYVRILCIRENEHFGDVLMFLGQPSPLRVRVRSKKAELFFLRKIDAIKISSSYKNIWRRINKKSVYNYEQIKKSIKNIVELYCSLKLKNDDEVISLPRKRKTSIIALRSPAYLLQKPISNKLTNFPLKKSNSEKNIHAKIILKNNIFPILDKNIINNNINLQSTKNIDKLNKNFSKNFSIQKSDFNDDSSSMSISSENKIKINKKSNKKQLIDTCNGNHKYYKSSQINKKEKKHSINDENLSQHKTTAKKICYHKKNAKKDKIDKSKLMDKFNYNMKENKSSSITQKFSNTFSVVSKIEPENFSSFNEDNSEKDKKNSNISNYGYTIVNDEIYPGEEFKLNTQKSLNLFKTINDIFPKYNLVNLRKDVNNSNNNLKKLLDDINYSFISDNKNNISIKNINNNLNCSCQCHNKEKTNIENLKNNNNNFNQNKQKFLTTNLSIDSTINIEYNSLYENLNILNNKISTDKELQQKIKNILINYSAFSPKNSSIKFSNIEKNYPRRDNKLHTLKSNSLKYTLSLAGHHKNSKIERDSSFFKKRSGTFNSDSNESKNYNFSSRSKTKTKFQFGFPRQKSISKKKFSAKKVNLLGRESTIKNNKRRNNTIISPHVIAKKKKSNLLSQINFNIEKTNENLNNPDEFYVNYFQTLLETEKIKEKKAKRKMSSFVIRPNRIETLKTFKTKREKRQKVA